MEDLYLSIKRFYPEQWENLIIDDFFHAHYYERYLTLSKVIPQDFAIVDYGCGNACQSFFFREFDRYFGIDIVERVRLELPNTVYLDFLEPEVLIKNYGLNLDKTFAIASNIRWSKQTNIADKLASNFRANFTNLFSLKA